MAQEAKSVCKLSRYKKKYLQNFHAANSKLYLQKAKSVCKTFMLQKVSQKTKRVCKKQKLSAKLSWCKKCLQNFHAAKIVYKTYIVQKAKRVCENQKCLQNFHAANSACKTLSAELSCCKKQNVSARAKRFCKSFNL